MEKQIDIGVEDNQDLELLRDLLGTETVLVGGGEIAVIA
jgi:hypothetical protein